MTLKRLIQLVPDHCRIGIVEADDMDRRHTLYSGYKGDFIKFCNNGCIYPADYEVISIHAGSWECKMGLIIGVRLIKNRVWK